MKRGGQSQKDCPSIFLVRMEFTNILHLHLYKKFVTLMINIYNRSVYISIPKIFVANRRMFK
ncbi:hypothetical protein SAMN05878391_1659 [Salinicoccus kekensis]|uniref:Uncharacterized protein n=1 Tax=Salinicoccus kekensis TaxID=714307 RepID=A0A285ULW4_9STAP|nr:hypothetical protein SAMN05878391_1659 [Salinicoccus kekensis]